MISTQRLYQINSSRILQHIWHNPGKSRISIAGDLDLNRSTITKAVRFFLENGIVRITGKRHDTPGAGRMAIGLEINSSFIYVLGIEAQTEFFRTVIVDLEGTIFKSDLIEYSLDGETLEDQLVSVIRAEKERADAAGIPLVGVGVGVAGVIDPYTGTVVNSRPLAIRECSLKTVLEERCGMPVFVENDANCCCWSEMAFPRTSRARNFISLLGEFRNNDVENNRRHGFSFGVGVVIRDDVLHGDNFTVGEFQSLLCDSSVEGYSQFSYTDDDLVRVPEDRELLEKVFSEISYNLSFLVNMLDITKVVIAGDMADYAALLSPLMNRAIQRNALYHQQPKECVVEYSPDGLNAVCMGAAGLFIKKLFSVPGMTDHVDEEVGSILLGRVLSLCGRKG